jgi:hypothetical protein
MSLYYRREATAAGAKQIFHTTYVFRYIHVMSISVLCVVMPCDPERVYQIFGAGGKFLHNVCNRLKDHAVS